MGEFQIVMLSKRSQIPERTFSVTILIQKSKNTQNESLLSGQWFPLEGRERLGVVRGLQVLITLYPLVCLV